MHAPALSPSRRMSDLERMSNGVADIIVIGGGVNGAGIALDAATRGLSVGLVEQRDLASGTSSRSSKLIHGGLRYLEQLNFSLVREALREQTLLMERLAPHLIRAVPFMYPLTRPVWERGYVGAGVALYDTIAGPRKLPRHRHLSRARALAVAPALRHASVVGAIQYWDARVDDARHTMELARTAASYGAAVATSVRVTDFLREDGKVVGVRVTDRERREERLLRAKHVINATGVWIDDVQAMLVGGRPQVRPSKGIHVVVPRSRIASKSGLILRTRSSVLFVIPWGDYWLLGTTDSEWRFSREHPAASRADIDYLLGHVNSVLRVPLTSRDVYGVYAGLRPLVDGGGSVTTKLSREHSVTRPYPGLTTVSGGKYTTYRVVAADAVDSAVAELGGFVPPSATDRIPLLGALGFDALWNSRDRIAKEAGMATRVVEHLLRRYGSLTSEVLDLIADSPELGAPISGSHPYLKAEAVYAASHEGSLHLDDVLTRRTRLSIEAPDRGVASAKVVAPLVGEVLGWDDEQIAYEVSCYEARVSAELQSQNMLDDQAADLARASVPDVRGP